MADEDVVELVESFLAAAAPLLEAAWPLLGPASALSKYLSKAALAFPGGPNGPFSVFPPPRRSLEADLARCISLVAVDILDEVDSLEAFEVFEATETELMSEPEPNSRSSEMLLSAFLVIDLSLPRRPLLFFFSPGRSSLCVLAMLSRDPVLSLSTLVSLSSLLMVMAL